MADTLKGIEKVVVQNIFKSLVKSPLSYPNNITQVLIELQNAIITEHSELSLNAVESLLKDCFDKANKTCAEQYKEQQYLKEFVASHRR